MIGDYIILLTRPLALFIVCIYILMFIYSSFDVSSKGYDDSSVNEKFSAALLASIYLLITLMFYDSVSAMESIYKIEIFFVRAGWIIFFTTQLIYEIKSIKERGIVNMNHVNYNGIDRRHGA